MNGLEQVYGDRMVFQVKDYQQGDSPGLIERYGLGRHGMVITDAEGNKLWSEPGHKQTREGVEQAIKRVLGP